MKKTIIAVFFVLLCSALTAQAIELKVGEKAPDFLLKDSLGNVYTLDSPEFKGKVLSIFYVDPHEKDLNSYAENTLLANDGLDRKNGYKYLCIANLKASKLPNLIIKREIKNKQEKTGSIILLDLDYGIIKEWGLRNHSSDVVVLDKERICRYVYNGKLPSEEVEKLINVIKEYQVK
jgi:predicted transcriptional regulator